MSRDLEFRVTEHLIVKGVEVVEMIYQGRLIATMVAQEDQPIIRIVTKHKLQSTVTTSTPISFATISFAIQPE